MLESILLLSLFLAGTAAQSIPVPPLQWINLSPLLQGSSAPPPLRDASIGYDDESRSLVIFGGESEGGFVQSRTFLLNLENLTWSTPSPPANLVRSPAARSAALSGLDFAASNRHAFLVIGGKGADDVALSDVWAFDFTNHFWSQVSISSGGPAGRWNAAGGIDHRTPPVPDRFLPGPNNTFFLAGGVDREQLFPLSDVWRLNVSGILSANLPNSIQASWQQQPLASTLPGRDLAAGNIIGQRIVITGGCDDLVDDSQGDPTCARQDSYVIQAEAGSVIAPSASCPPPRLDPVLVPNMNTFSSGFASQAFLVLGTVNTDIWDDGGGMEQGEIDVLDVNTGSWSRVLPSGDLSISGEITFPTPREGVAAFTYPRSLVGSTRDGISDTILFGGRDASGKYLSEMWILRSYPAVLGSSSASWPGYGDGQLTSGINANGNGVTIKYMDKCASLRKQADDPKPDDDDDSGDDTSDPQLDPPQVDTNNYHKILSCLSLLFLFLSTVIFRRMDCSFSGSKLHQLSFVSLVVFTLGSYALGIVGFVFAFTSLSHRTSETDNTLASSGPSNLTTPHGIASLVFFTLLYAVLPLLVLAALLSHRSGRSSDTESSDSALRNLSPSFTEKQTSVSPSPIGLRSPSLPLPSTPFPPNSGSGPSHPARRSLEALSEDGDSSMISGTPRRGFEVVNRPARTRKQSETWSTSMGHSSPHMILSSRSLGDIDWLLRRRSLNAVGELDYALSIAHNAQRNSAAPSDAVQLTTQVTNNADRDAPLNVDIAVYFLAHTAFLGLHTTTLIALWRHAPRVFFILFLVCVAGIYVLHCFLFRHRFRVESCVLAKFKHQRPPLPTEPPTSALPDDAHTPFHPDAPSTGTPGGPYIHHPPFLRTVPGDAPYMDDRRTAEGYDDDDDLDDDARQRMIEEEMDRREVSIITVPKRKLWVANPS